jgi:two-component system, LytTR family, sensor kinase
MESGSRAESMVRWWSAPLCWLAFGFVNAVDTVFIMRREGMHHAWVWLFATTVFSWLPWVLATNPILSLGRIFPPFGLSRVRAWVVHTLGWLAMAVLFATWTAWIDMIINPYAVSKEQSSFRHNWFDLLSDNLLPSFIIYLTILVIAHALTSQIQLKNQQIESAQMSEQLLKAQLAALRSQIEPHFLFNSLNAAVGLVREGRNDAAADMITGLSDFLRHTLKQSVRQEIALGEELEFVHKYLTIQKVRFGDRLQFSMDVPTELHDIRVPCLILQPIVENAVKHGIAHRAKGGVIEVNASRRDNMLRLTVRNDGPPMGETFVDGTGMSNVRDRLQALYGTHFELSLRARDAGGAEASLVLPLPRASGSISG